VADHRDGSDRREHQPDRRQRDRAHVAAQGVQVREERRRVQQWRQEDDQDEVGLELDVRNARHQPEHQAAEHERDRVRDVEPAREHVEPRDRHEQREDEDLEVLHR
jgi:hypothetical protein